MNLLDEVDVSSIYPLGNSNDNRPQSTDEVMIMPENEDWMWQDLSLAQSFQDINNRQLQLSGSAFSMIQHPTLYTDRFGGMDLYAPDDLFCSSISISSPISMNTPPAYQCFQSPRDPEYYQSVLEDKVKGLATILPLKDFVADDRLSAPHLYSAALALSALNFPDEESHSPSTDEASSPKRHALRHYATALQTLHSIFPDTAAEAFRDVGLDDLLAWLLTRLVLANFDLRWGLLAAWRAHLRAAGRVLSAWHSRIMSSPKGRPLAHAFARMALLVEMQNDQYSVTNLNNMNPGVASDLASMMELSDSPRDRLLVLIQEVSKLELKFRYRPNLNEKWAMKMEMLEKQLLAWQRRLPASELPVDTGLEEPVAFPPDPSYPSTAAPVDMTPLTFPNSSDPYTAAVNYAHFLCARMRTRTRYFDGADRLQPSDTERTVRHICRIAAGLSPAACGQADAFGHGMMPAIVGAYRWTQNTGIRSWIAGWLSGYEAFGPREGIWNVSQARRLLKFIDAELVRRRRLAGNWDIISARVEEDDALEDDERVWDCAISRGFGALDFGDREHFSGKEAEKIPFRIVLHSRSNQGWATDHCIVP